MMIRYLEEKDVCPDCGQTLDKCECEDSRLVEYDYDGDYYYDNVTFTIVIPDVSNVDIEEIIETVRSKVDDQYEVLDYTYEVIEARYTYISVAMKIQIQDESDTEFIDDIINFASDNENLWDARDVEHSTNLNEDNNVLDTAEKAAKELMKDIPSKQAKAIVDPDITTESPNITEISFDSDEQSDYDNEEDLEIISDIDQEQDKEEDQINEVTNPGAISNIPGKHIKYNSNKCNCKKCRDNDEELECNLSEELGDSTAQEINTQLSTFYDQLNEMGKFFVGSENSEAIQAIKDLQTILKDLKV